MPYRSREEAWNLPVDHVAPRYALRLEDLRPWHRIRVTCLNCRHLALLDPAAFKRRWPGYTRFITIERKLRCRQCGRREVSWQVCRLPRG